MAISVRELLQLPYLRAELLAGAGGIDAQVTWVHTSDLPNPWEWQGPGELLLTNGTGLLADPDGQVEFVERLAACGASGLAIGLGMPGPALTPQLLSRADELTLPVLTVPFSVPFTSMVRAVAAANDREESQQMLVVARLYELLRQSIAAGSTGPGLLQRLGRELGVRLYLVDPATGHSLLDDGDDNPYAASLAAGYAQHGQALPGVLQLTPDGHAGDPAIAVAVPAARPTALVVESFTGALPGTVLLQHAAAGAALELAQLTARQETRRRVGAEFLAQMLDRRTADAAANAYLLEMGLSPAHCTVVVLRGDVAASDAPGELTRLHLPHLSLERPPFLYLLVPEAALQDAADGWLAGKTAGASEPVGVPSRVRDAATEAEWALAAAEFEGVPLLRFGEQSLLLPRSAIEAEAITTRILGPLLALGDRADEYIATVRAMLDQDRSWQRAASVLHIHKQTLGYRLRKIESLSGRGFVRTEHLSEWWVAMRAYDLLARRPHVAR
jgi:PucR family transcriptional regulator, purine catabolism regulatory protein